MRFEAKCKEHPSITTPYRSRQAQSSSMLISPSRGQAASRNPQSEYASSAQNCVKVLSAVCRGFVKDPQLSAEEAGL
jgi:hypothetical protein